MSTPPCLPLHVVVTDDEELVRTSLAALVDQMPNMRVVGEAADGQALLELMDLVRADLVLMDLAMPRVDGLTATRRLGRRHPRVAVVAMSMDGSASRRRLALDSGADAYVPKCATPARLERVLRVAAQRHRRHLATHVAAAAPPLTALQARVLRLLAEGRGPEEIAGLLGISPVTAERERVHLYARLGINDLAAITRYALHEGLAQAVRRRAPRR